MNLVFLLEERSAEEMLKGVLPKLLPAHINTRYLVFEGKQDLEKQLQKRLQGWRLPNTVFLVMRDKDGGDGPSIKQQLMQKVIDSGKQQATLVRIACTELESFYLGDLNAVEHGLGIANLAKKQNDKKYRTPDVLSNAAQELKRLTQNQYEKVSGSRAISAFLKVDGSNRSHSFNVLLTGINKLITLCEAEN
jgi:LAS superfamily LD-carboxypeptidase LdcB